MGLLGKLFGSAKAEARPASPEPVLVNAYATVRDLPPIDFAHEFHNQRDRSDPELPAHLDGFIGYVMSRGDGEMTARRYHLWRHIERVRHQLSFSAEEKAFEGMERWALAANAILFLPDGSIRAPDGGVLIDAGGESDPAAALPYPPDAMARRERTLSRMARIEPKPPASMPPSLGTAELELRPAVEVQRRALALLCVAVHAEGIGTGQPDIRPRLRELNPVGMAALSPAEKTFIEADKPDAKAVAQMGWRYEALNTLLWALGDPTGTVERSDVAAEAAIVSRAARELASRPADQARLRPAPEILDALDRTWREQWVVRETGKSGKTPEGLNPDVLMERHVALNWLTGFQNEPGTGWDDIDTPS